MKSIQLDWIYYSSNRPMWRQLDGERATALVAPLFIIIGLAASDPGG